MKIYKLTLKIEAIVRHQPPFPSHSAEVGPQIYNTLSQRIQLLLKSLRLLRTALNISDFVSDI